MVENTTFTQAVKKALEEKTGYPVTVKEVTTNNSTKYTGIEINDGSTTLSTLYLDSLFHKYEEGTGIEEIADLLIKKWKNAKGVTERLNTKDVLEVFKNWEQAKHHLKVTLVNKLCNADFLKTAPYRDFFDLAYIAKFEIENPPSESERFSIRVLNEHLKIWGVSAEDVMDIAIKNTRESDFIARPLTFDDEGKPLVFAVTNKYCCNGANAFLKEDLFKLVAKMYEKDLLIFPSSIHELVFTFLENDYCIEEATNLINKINATKLSPEEILSDHPYFYSLEKGFYIV